MPVSIPPRLSPADIHALAESMDGPVVRPGTDDYEQARGVWNAAVDHRPALIARCLSVEDVQRAVALARDRELPVSVRAGGHSIAGHGVGDGSVMIDLSTASEIVVDQDGRLLTVRGGATWGDVMERCAEYDLATPGAFNHHVGISGLTLGGGYGALTRLHGLTCDNLVEAEIVTADGAVRRVSVREGSDLFWAVRGAGANFGVTTSLTFRLHPVGRWLAGSVTWPVARYRDVVRFYRDFVAGLPDEASAYLGMNNARRHEGFVFIIALFAGSREEGERVLAPLRSFGSPMSVDLRPRRYLELHDNNVEAFPTGHHNYWKACFLRDLSDEVIEQLDDYAQRTEGTDFYFVLEHLGGAMGRIAPQATAFPHRDARFGLAVTCKWRRPGEGERLVGAARGLHAAVWPHSTGGTYVNYLGCDAAPEDVSIAYGGNLTRLTELKRRYDPANLFRFNINISPGG